jgi:hypothetical protein
VACTIMPPILPHIQAGRVRGLAVTTAKRSSVLADVPTMAEAGFKGQESDTMAAFLVPAGTPKAIVSKLSADMQRVLAMPDVREKIAVQGFDVIASTPDQSRRREVGQGHPLRRHQGRLSPSPPRQAGVQAKTSSGFPSPTKTLGEGPCAGVTLQHDFLALAGLGGAADCVKHAVPAHREVEVGVDFLSGADGFREVHPHLADVV